VASPHDFRRPAWLNVDFADVVAGRWMQAGTAALTLVSPYASGRVRRRRASVRGPGSRRRSGRLPPSPPGPSAPTSKRTSARGARDPASQLATPACRIVPIGWHHHAAHGDLHRARLHRDHVGRAHVLLDAIDVVTHGPTRQPFAATLRQAQPIAVMLGLSWPVPMTSDAWALVAEDCDPFVEPRPTTSGRGAS
jgi:hypothetical protein